MTMSRNIIYRSDSIARFYAVHRRRWDEFYPSERTIFEWAARRAGGLGRVLDVGCAAGGLGAALAGRFPVAHYTGVDVNAQAIEAARSADDLHVPSEFHEADIVGTGLLSPEGYDTVVSLGCADFNIETRAILSACWRHVAPRGRFILSLRLTTQATANDLARSYQVLDFQDGADIENAERAPYVVLNILEALDILGRLDPSPETLRGVGYFGKPSPSARTEFREVLFAVFSLERTRLQDEPRLQLDFPWSAWR